MIKFEINYSQWAAQFNNAVAGHKERLAKTIYSAFEQMAYRIIKDTPYGKPELWQSHYAPPGYTPGHLKNNWQTTLNNGASGIVDSYSIAGTSSIAGTTEAKGFKLGDTIYFSNLLPYAQVIENGHSKQAPVGMVKKNLSVFRNKLIFKGK